MGRHGSGRPLYRNPRRVGLYRWCQSISKTQSWRDGEFVDLNREDRTKWTEIVLCVTPKILWCDIRTLNRNG